MRFKIKIFWKLKDASINLRGSIKIKKSYLPKNFWNSQPPNLLPFKTQQDKLLYMQKLAV